MGQYTLRRPSGHFQQLANKHLPADEESEESSSDESVEVPVARRKFADEEDSDDVR